MEAIEQELSPCEAFERKLVHHCTPTLAALKPANLFTCRSTLSPTAVQHGRRPTAAALRDDQLSDALRACRATLAPPGGRIEVLARRTSGALVYVYRPRLLTRAIQQEQVAAFLTAEGYDPSSLSACIEKLHKRICGTDLQSQMTGRCSFPHEIGFFLGYPYEDVIGFIDNEGENFLCSGCWKVYAKERDAQTCFCCYKNCTTMYQQLFDEGVSIECLAAVDEDFPAAEAALLSEVRGAASSRTSLNRERLRHPSTRRRYPMSKVAIVYWSGTGNTEAMADLIAQGVRAAGGTADLVHAADFTAERVEDYDALAFGCPAMGDEELEDMEFLPMYDQVEPHLAGHKVVLFGSYEWNDGEWMELWEKRAEEAGVDVADSVIAYDYPDDEASAECLRVGNLLAG